jgi:hypothetical protein
MNNLKFDLKEIRSERGYIERGIFSLAPEVPVAITISANLETAQIKIVTKNLEKFGEYTYTYDYDEFSNEIMEELGKIIIDKPNKFRTMGKHQAAMRSTSTPPLQAMPGVFRTVQPIPGKSDESAETVKGFLGNIKTILKG